MPVEREVVEAPEPVRVAAAPKRRCGACAAEPNQLQPLAAAHSPTSAMLIAAALGSVDVAAVTGELRYPANVTGMVATSCDERACDGAA